jgi:hypothetical protein
MYKSISAARELFEILLGMDTRHCHAKAVWDAAGLEHNATLKSRKDTILL